MNKTWRNCPINKDLYSNISKATASIREQRLDFEDTLGNNVYVMELVSDVLL